MSRRELEDLWRERVAELRLEYERASAEWRKILEEHPVAAPDGAFRVKRALLVETEARRKFTNAIVKFNDLVIRGIIPEE
jgi:hypothetical protein